MKKIISEEFKRMQKLAGLLKENQDKYYDFGGGEYPADESDPNCIVVDKMSEKKFRSFGYENPFIQADLNKKNNFTPLNNIRTSSTIEYINNLDNFAYNINNALNKGGKFSVWSTLYSELPKIYKLIDILESKYGFKVNEADLEDIPDSMKKDYINNLNPEDIENYDPDEDGDVELSITLIK